MRKCDELKDPKSCLNKARGDEWLFVLLERDGAAADTIRFWVRRRIALLKNFPDDEQMTEALALADAMDEERRQIEAERGDV